MVSQTNRDTPKPNYEKRTPHIFHGHDVFDAVTRAAIYRSLARLPGTVGKVFSIDRVDGGRH
jgi:hypothetical protein